ncbi:MAG: ATP-binding cassette domain-containing protein, partial [Desulfobacula sp.]
MIEVQNLTKYYKDFCAVNNISMTIQKGEILGLLGPNGAGKTTTLRMLTGFLRPNSGTIKVNDFHM